MAWNCLSTVVLRQSEIADFRTEALGRPVDLDHPETRGNYRMLETPPDGGQQSSILGDDHFKREPRVGKRLIDIPGLRQARVRQTVDAIADAVAGIFGSIRR